MKLAEFQKSAPTTPAASDGEVNKLAPRGAEAESGCDAPAPDTEFVTSITPSGIEVYYSWAPRRHYKLRQQGTKTWGDLGPHEWLEVPSVTTILGVLDRSGPLTWWGMRVGVAGYMSLVAQDAGPPAGELEQTTFGPDDPVVAEAVEMLTKHRLTVNHVKDQAADRGVNVHGALEAWVENKQMPLSHEWPEHERGYIEGLFQFLFAVNPAAQSVQAELMVGSLEHQYAGRFDLVLTLSKPVEVVTRHYPKRKDKVEEISAGRYLMDLKTRKKASVYNTNYLQLEAYEHAAVECGYAPTDYRAVIMVTEDGGYQVSVNKDWCFEDFLAVRKCYQVLNEREALRILRDELDATEVVH